jgi:Big-like domain-containing protein
MNDSDNSADGRSQHWTDLEVLPVGHAEDAFALFDSETDRPRSMSQRAVRAVNAIPFGPEVLVALVGVVAGTIIGVGFANHAGRVTSDRPPQAPVAAATALPSAPHVAARLSLPFRTTHEVQGRPGVVVDLRRDTSAPIAVKQQRVARRPVRARLSARVAKVIDAAPAANVATLPIDAGPVIVVDDDTTPRSVARVAAAAEGVNPVPAAPFQLAVAGSASDPDGDGLTYQWSAPIGSFADPGASRTTFACPDTPIEVPLTVTVTDNHGASASDTVIVRCIAAARENSR